MQFSHKDTKKSGQNKKTFLFLSECRVNNLSFSTFHRTKPLQITERIVHKQPNKIASNNRKIKFFFGRLA